jgi:hypothetical protein
VWTGFIWLRRAVAKAVMNLRVPYHITNSLAAGFTCKAIPWSLTVLSLVGPLGNP